MRCTNLRWAIFFCFFSIILLCCRQKADKEITLSDGNKVILPQNTTAELTRKQLAQGYCASCHLFPEPNLLDKKTWENRVLPNMGLRLGLGGDSFDKYAGLAPEEIMTVVQAGIYPDTPYIKESDWQKIVAYYLKEAPDQLIPQTGKAGIKIGLRLFQEILPPPHKHQVPLITLLKIDAQNQRIFAGDHQKNLFILDQDLRIIDSLILDSPPVDLTLDAAGNFSVLTIGQINPSDRAEGNFSSFQSQARNGILKQSNLLASLKRPVDITTVDLDQDGLEDLIICQHGNHSGRLSWYRKTKEGSYQEQVLKEIAGVRKTIVQDFNHDGKPDILALFAQGREQIIIFYNQGNGRFSEKIVLQFPPVYGSSYIDLVDFNQDGALDILYSNGDNADYSYSLKPYHGLRIYLNDKKDNFREAWFFPMYGASMVRALDFDQDGDLDITAIAYFPDYEKQPEAGFLYLENKGNLKFEASTFKNSTLGRWLVMDTGDIDQDGDDDIILGSYINSPTPAPDKLQQEWKKGSHHILFLKNKLYP